MASLSTTLTMVDRFSNVASKITSSMKTSEQGMKGFKQIVEKPFKNGVGDQMQKEAVKSNNAMSNMTRGFSRIGQGMSGISNKVQSATSVAKRAVSSVMTSTGNAITNGVSKLNTAVSKPFNRGPGKQLQEEAQKADQAFNQMQSGATKTGSIFKSVVGGALVGSAISKGMGVIKGSIDSAISRVDTLNNANKVFGNLGLSAKASSAGMAQLDKAIDGLPTGLDTAVQGVQTFVSTNGDMNKSVKLYKAVNDTILGFGGNTEQSASAVMQLGKAFGTGKIQGDAFNALIENGASGALPELAKKMGMTQEKMVEMGSKGKLSADKFGKALIDLNEKGGEKMAATSKMAKDATAGISTAIAVAKGAIVRSVGHVIQQIGPQIATFFQGVKAKLNEMKPLFQAFGQVMGKAFKVAGDAAVFLAPLAKAVAPMAGIFLSASAGAYAFHKSMGMVNNAMKMFMGNKLLTVIFLLGTAFFYAYQNNEDFRNCVNKAVEEIAKFAKWVGDSIGKLDGMKLSILGITGVLGLLGGAFAVKKLLGWVKGIGKASKAAKDLGSAGNVAKSGTEKIKKGFASLQKMAGIALVISSIALLAFAMAPLAQAGKDGAVGMLAFGVSVAIMAGVLGAMGSKLSAGVVGIVAFAVAVGIMALAMAPIAQSGTDGAIAISAFALSITLLAVVMALLGPLLTVAAAGMLAFGAAILLVGLGVGIASAGMALLASQLPIIAIFGLQAALGLLALGGATIVFGIGAMIAGVGLLILSVGLIMLGAGAIVAAIGVLLLSVATLMLGVGLIIVAGTVIIVAVGMMMMAAIVPMLAMGFMLLVVPVILLTAMFPLLGLGMVAVGVAAIASVVGVGALGLALAAASVGALALMAALAMIKSQLSSISQSATSTASSLKEMVTAIDVVKTGLSTIESAAQSAVQGLLSVFSGGVGQAKSNGNALGLAASTGVTAGLTAGTPSAMAAMLRLVTMIRTVGMSAVGSMRSIGLMIGQGLAAGMNAALGSVTAAANRLVGEAERAARAKAKIHSPSRLMRDQVGYYIGAGMAVGMDNSANLISKSANGLVDSAISDVNGSTLNVSDKQQVIASGLVSGSGATNSSNTSNSQTINIQAGAIQVTADQAMDPQEMLRVLEQSLVELQNQNLSVE